MFLKSNDAFIVQLSQFFDDAAKDNKDKSKDKDKSRVKDSHTSETEQAVEHDGQQQEQGVGKNARKGTMAAKHVKKTAGSVFVTWKRCEIMSFKVKEESRSFE